MPCLARRGLRSVINRGLDFQLLVHPTLNVQVTLSRVGARYHAAPAGSHGENRAQRYVDAVPRLAQWKAETLAGTPMNIGTSEGTVLKRKRARREE